MLVFNRAIVKPLNPDLLVMHRAEIPMETGDVCFGPEQIDTFLNRGMMVPADQDYHETAIYESLECLYIQAMMDMVGALTEAYRQRMALDDNISELKSRIEIAAFD